MAVITKAIYRVWVKGWPDISLTLPCIFRILMSFASVIVLLLGILVVVVAESPLRYRIGYVGMLDQIPIFWEFDEAGFLMRS